MFIMSAIYELRSFFESFNIFEGISSNPVATLDFIRSIIFSTLEDVSFSNVKGRKPEYLFLTS